MATERAADLPADITDVLIVRHPETEANVTGRFVGRGDSVYTAEGRRQLVRAARVIERFSPDRIWTSPLRRASALARRASHGIVPLTIDDRLVELNFGLAEGMTADEIAEAGLVFDYRSMDEPVAPEGEGRLALARRAAEALDAVVAEGGFQAVVTHGGVFRAGLAHLLGLSAEDIWAFHVHNAQIAHVRVSGGHGTLERFVQA